MWERHLSPGPDGNSNQIKDGSWVMRSVRSHLFISTGGGYRIYTTASTLMMLDACHRQVRTTCHRISDQSSKASLLLPRVIFCWVLAQLWEFNTQSTEQNGFNVERNKETCTMTAAPLLIFLISSSLKETSRCFCTIVKTPNIKDPISFINIFPLCQSYDRGHFLKYISALTIMQDEECCLVTSVF